MPTAGDGARGWETKAIGSTSSALISTDAACMIRSTLRTKRKPVALRRRIPSIPARHPDLIRTRSPTFKKGWGSALRVDKTALSASTSDLKASCLAQKNPFDSSQTSRFDPNPVADFQKGMGLGFKGRQNRSKRLDIFRG